MLTQQQQFAELNQANLEKSIRLTGIAIAGAERLFNLQLQLARDLLAENAATAKALSSVKSLQDMMALQGSLAQPSVERTMTVARNVYEAANSTQNELNKLVEEQLIEFNKNLLDSLDKAIAQAPASSAAVSVIKSAVESASSAYDTMSKTTQRIASELVEATSTAVENTAKAVSSRKK